MSEESLEVVQRFMTLFLDGGMHAAADLMDPEVVFSEPPEQPGATTFHGIQDVVAGFGRWSETWESQHSEVERVVENGDQVLVLHRETLVGRDGITVQQPCGTLVEVRDGKVIRFASYWDQSTALEALGPRNSGL